MRARPLVALAMALVLALAVLAGGGGLVGSAAAANAPTCAGDGTDFAGGDGSEANPYEIADVHELQCMGHDDHLDENFELTADVDASETAEWNDEGDGPLGFDPIGEADPWFTGSFDGNGHEIDGLTIDRSGERNVGLFGFSLGPIEDVALTNVSIVGDTHVGGLVGHSQDSVSNVSASGTVTGTAAVGGLVGRANPSGTVTNSSASVDVTASGDFAGGLIGITAGPVSHSWASGDVNSDRGDAGGLIGQSDAPVSNASASGDVDGGDSRVGGLIGQSNGAVSNASASGDVAAVGQDVGGLIGSSNREVSHSWASGDVNSDEDVGGLVGFLPINGEVTRSYAVGNVTGDEDIGGLVGVNGGDVRDSYATGDVDGNIGVGGLVGRVDITAGQPGSVTTSYAAGNVSGTTDVGGLVGDAGQQGSATDSYWDEDTTGQDNSAGGAGAVGFPTANVTGTAAATNMTGFDFGGTWTTTDSYPVLLWSVTDYAVGVDEGALTVGNTTGTSATLSLVDGRTVGASDVSSYASDDGTVASVTDGTVTAQAAGTTTILGSNGGLSDGVGLSVETGSDDTGGGGEDPPATASIAVAQTSLSSGQIEPGESVAVSVTLENDGDGDGTHEVSLLVDDETVDSTTVFVGAGGSHSISFSQTFESAGEYAIVADETTVGTVTVAEQGQSTETPAGTDGDQSTEEPTPTETATESPTTSSPGGGTPTPDDGGLPILPILAVLLIVAILAAAGFLWARQS